MRSLMLIIAGFLTLTTDSLAAPVPKAEKDPLQGTWELVEFDNGSGAKTTGAMIGRKWTFEGEKLTIHRTDVSSVTTYKSNADADPKQVEWVATGNKVCKGIYVIDGDKLKICYGINETPKKIAPGIGISVFTFKRSEKPK